MAPHVQALKELVLHRRAVMRCNPQTDRVAVRDQRAVRVATLKWPRSTEPT